MNSEVIYNVQAGPFWDWRIAADLFFGGAGVGALLFAVFLDEYFKGKYQRICRTAAYLAPILIILGLVLLILKMGRPFHLYLTYLNFNPSAPLWWGGIFQPLLVIGAIVYAWRWRMRQPLCVFRQWLGRCLVPVALVVGAYHGLLLSLMVSRPLWNTGPTVVAAMLGFASTGIAVVMLVHLLRMKLAGRFAEPDHIARFFDDMRIVRNVLVGVLILQLATFFFWWLSLRFGSLQDQQALDAANASYGPMFWWFGIGAGLILPLVLGAIAVIRGEAAHRSFQITMITVTSLLILIGGFIFRLAVVLGGQVDLPVHVLS